MDTMMRHMDGAMRAANGAAAGGALPADAVFVGQTSSFNSDGTRVTSTTRAAGGVSARVCPGAAPLLPG